MQILIKFINKIKVFLTNHYRYKVIRDHLLHNIGDSKYLLAIQFQLLNSLIKEIFYLNNVMVIKLTINNYIIATVPKDLILVFLKNLLKKLLYFKEKM